MNPTFSAGAGPYKSNLGSAMEIPKSAFALESCDELSGAVVASKAALHGYLECVV